MPIISDCAIFTDPSVLLDSLGFTIRVVAFVIVILDLAAAEIAH